MANAFEPLNPQGAMSQAAIAAQQVRRESMLGQEADPEVASAPTFEQSLLERINRDYSEAKRFLDHYHRWCLAMDNVYHNAKDFEDLQKNNKFPMPLIQKNVDQTGADMMDKLFYAGRPASLIPDDNADPLDIDAKQEMLDYQDKQDMIYSKLDLCLRSALLKNIAVAQVDYKDTKRRVWAPTPQPILQSNPETGLQEAVIDPATGQPATQDVFTVQEVPDYRGASVKRIDPINLFFTKDKTEIGDGQCIMVRSMVDDEHFNSESYFYNHDMLSTIGGESDGARVQDGVSVDEKLLAQGFIGGTQKAKKNREYVEWQGFVDKTELYQYLGADESAMAQVMPGEKCWVIAGVTDGQVLMRCSADPFQINKENIVVGTISSEDEGMIGIGLAKLIQAIQRGSDGMTGYLMENLKQSVNRGWILNKNKIVNETGQTLKVNNPGFIVYTNDDVGKVAMPVEQPPISEDIWKTIQWFDQLSQDAGGLRDSLQGEIDPRANTLGQTQLAAGSASLRIRKYLKTFEDTFVRPLYDLRDWINSTFIDTEYAYYVLGPSGVAWKKISPAAVKSRGQFMCESSTRETNKAVLIQQMIQVAPLLPLAQSAGIPVRIDKFFEKLMKSGFAWSQDDVDELLPTIKLEREGMDINTQMFANTQAAMMAQNAPPGKQPDSAGPESTDEGRVENDMMAQSRPQTMGVMG